jgi:serine/threonine-protein kinase
VSAALAAVLESATAKRLDERYASDAELISDLEDVLAIEAARAGSTTGEATTVLRTLPAGKQRRVPFLVRHRRVAALAALVLLLAAAAVAAVLILNVHHNAGARHGSAPGPPTAVRLCGDCAEGFNPLGKPTDEAPNAGRAIDGNPATFWTTQDYFDPLQELKAGTGLYVDTSTPVVLRQLRILTDTPGFTATIYARTTAPPIRWPDSGWVRVSSPTVVTGSDTIALQTGGRAYRYVLIWITSLGASEHADLNEVTPYT